MQADQIQAYVTGCSITLNGGGSGTGLKQVADGSVNIGNSDVPAESKLKPEVAKGLVDHKVCVVTMAPVINKDLAAKVKSLTKAQLTDIFTAKVTNWKQVGGPDEPIVLITRPATSGTALSSRSSLWAVLKKQPTNLWKLMTPALCCKA